MSSPHTARRALKTQTEVCALCLTTSPVPLSPPYTDAPPWHKKAAVKVNKRCLWIFWVTNSNRCLHSPCNYLLTDLIPGVKWLAKSMCMQTGLGSEVVHAHLSAVSVAHLIHSHRRARHGESDLAGAMRKCSRSVHRKNKHRLAQVTC